MFCNSTITDLFLFVFTQLILHYQNFSADTSTLNLFFENNVNNFKLGHENYEKSIFNELPYGKCETFDQAYELMKNKE